MEERVKFIATIIIPYCFLCAGLYQISFWSTFEINIFSFLDIADILKSFIYPFIYSSAASIIFYVIQYNQLYDIFPYGGGNTEPQSKKKQSVWKLIKVLYISSLVFGLLLLPSKYKGLFLPLLFLPGAYFIVSEFLIKEGLLKDKFRHLLIYFLILLPALSITRGKRNAIEIYENISFDYSTKILPDKPIKFLGKASNHYIFMNLENTEKFFFDISEIKGLSMFTYEKGENNPLPTVANEQ